MSMFKKFQTETNGESSFFIYIPNFLLLPEIINLKEWLESLEYMSDVNHNGIEISRKQLWFQEEEKYFCPIWKHRYPRWNGQKYNKLLDKIQDKIKLFLNNKKYNNLSKNFNSCLINFYENGLNKIKPHRDSIDSFGMYPTIVNLSIGETRTMRVTKEKDIIDFPLENNSLFIMAGASQKYFLHEILEDKNINNSRYSLTFRNMIL